MLKSPALTPNKSSAKQLVKSVTQPHAHISVCAPLLAPRLAETVLKGHNW